MLKKYFRHLFLSGLIILSFSSFAFCDWSPEPGQDVVVDLPKRVFFAKVKAVFLDGGAIVESQPPFEGGITFSDEFEVKLENLGRGSGCTIDGKVCVNHQVVARAPGTTVIGRIEGKAMGIFSDDSVVVLTQVLKEHRNGYRGLGNFFIRVPRTEVTVCLQETKPEKLGCLIQ